MDRRLDAKLKPKCTVPLVPVSFSVVTTFKTAVAYKKWQWTYSAHITYAWHALLLWHAYLHIYYKYLVSERSERDTLSRSSMEKAIHIYIYRYVRHTLVARSWGYVMWEELSVSHF